MKKEYTNPTIKVVAIRSGVVMQTSGFPDSLSITGGYSVDWGSAD